MSSRPSSPNANTRRHGHRRSRSVRRAKARGATRRPVESEPDQPPEPHRKGRPFCAFPGLSSLPGPFGAFPSRPAAGRRQAELDALLEPPGVPCPLCLRSRLHLHAGVVFCACGMHLNLAADQVAPH